MEVETSCKHCGGKLIVYKSRRTRERGRLQYRKCKVCNLPASKKQVQAMVERITSLEARMDSAEKLLATVPEVYQSGTHV